MKISAFNDFWLDCYTTMLYSVLLSTNNIDKAYLYYNNYTYKITEIKSCFMEKEEYGISSYSEFSLLEKELLIDEEQINLYQSEKPIDDVKERIDVDKIVLAGVDLYYWVKETFHYKKNHVLHYALVSSYDERKKCLNVLETGESGYSEYKVSYGQAVEAMRAFDGPSRAYNINKNLRGLGYNKVDISTQAVRIIESINQILEQQDRILSVEEMKLDDIFYLNDIMQTHLLNMSNRAKVNKHLFMYSFQEHVFGDYDFCEKFEELETQYELLKNFCIRAGYKKEVRMCLQVIKEKVLKHLKEEREIWRRYLQCEEQMHMAVSF